VGAERAAEVARPKAAVSLTNVGRGGSTSHGNPFCLTERQRGTVRDYIANCQVPSGTDGRRRGRGGEPGALPGRVALTVRIPSRDTCRTVASAEAFQRPEHGALDVTLGRNSPRYSSREPAKP